MAGTYGEKKTWEDAKVTVMEFLDNFYDEAKDNYNQGFLELERRLQNYFEYEPRGEDSRKELSDGSKIASIRKIVESDELCAEAMVSEIGEIVS